MSKLRLRISMSTDGFVAGPNQSVKDPLGVGGEQLHDWVVQLEAWRRAHGMEGGAVNESTRVMEEELANIGATIMGRNMFGGGPGPWSATDPWKGWWGRNPPFHHPVFVLTYHAREPLVMEGGTTFRGAVAGVPAPLQPVAHALLQAAEDAEEILRDFPDEKLWTRPGGVASVGFHLQHMRGVIDRLFAYAEGKPLTEAQRAELDAEGKPPADDVSQAKLLAALREQVDQALDQLRMTDVPKLHDFRAVGRKQLPSTVQGLLFHAAEHVQRHLGQLLVTARVQDTERISV